MHPTKPTKESFIEKYFIYFGTGSFEDIVENVQILGQDKAKCLFIKFLSQYYAVFFDGFDKQIIVGRDKVFFSRNGRLVESTIGEAKINFKVQNKVYTHYTETLAEELNSMDNSIEIYDFPTMKSKEPRQRFKETDPYLWTSHYIVLLGVSFASKFYTTYNENEMRKYFVHTPELMSFLRRTKGAISLDPFSQEIRFENGEIGTYSYKRVLETNYYTDRLSSYYNNRNIGYKTVFALEERSKYSPIRGRRPWPSLTQYQAMYPDDHILYPMPDYRVNKYTCKWCGKMLQGKQTSYCSTDCRISFGRATAVERNGLLAYLILCRDNFTCTSCGSDLALINDYGQKIPIPRLCDTPDNDGKYRWIAEIDHIVAVKDGGNDHQSNLSTKCVDCHKEKHSKKKSISEGETLPSHKEKKGGKIIMLDSFRK